MVVRRNEMKQSYTLKINNPCGQDWHSMSITDKGKFCSLCSKTVVDFTKFSNDEVVQIIKQSSGKVCGRLTQQQLNNSIEIYQPVKHSRFSKVFAGLLLIGVAKNLPAQTQQTTQTEIVSVVNDEKLKEEQQQNTTDSLKNVIQGLVLDSATQKPLDYAFITIKGTTIETLSDDDGRFKLVIPDHLLSDKIYLRVTYVAYEKAEIIINKSDLPITKNIIMTLQEQILMGEIIIEKKKKWWQRKKK